MLDLYARMYRCMACRDLDEAAGVAPFVTPGPEQTVPVSHFGAIPTAKIWLVVTNPKGDRDDPNVGTLVRSFGKTDRPQLSDLDAERIFSRFSAYFADGAAGHRFFEPWHAILDGLVVEGVPCTFENGGVCAVDAIKCPTARDWQAFVRTPQGKAVWARCLHDSTGARHLQAQFRQHEPRVVVFAGTSGLVGIQERGRMDRRLRALAADRSPEIPKVWTSRVPKRLSLGLRGASRVGRMPFAELKALRDALADILAAWAAPE